MTPIAWAMVVVGIVLRLDLFLRNRSLFVDEAALALSLRDRSWGELFMALDFAQTAPIGFILLQKAVISIAGSSEYALRSLPLAAGIVALPVFLLIARRLLPRHLTAAAVALMALSTYQIFWSTDAKHYSLDVLFSLGLVLLAISWADDKSRTNTVRLAVIGAAAPFFSYAAVIVMTAVAPVLAICALRQRSLRGDPTPIRQLAVIFPAWLVGLPSVLHSRIVMPAETRRYMDAFWHEGFLPVPGSEDALSMWHLGFMRFMYDPVGMQGIVLVGLFAVLAAAGIAWLMRRSRLTGWLIVVPLVGVLLYSMAGLYPIGARWTYSGRVVLFLAPLGYLLAVAGTAWIRYRPLAVMVALLLIVPAVLRAGHAHSRGEARDALAYVASRSEGDDVVYLHYALRYPYLYYRPQIRGQITWGTCSQSDRAAYLHELEKLRGASRLWVVQAYDLYAEARLFRKYMRLNAVQSDSLVLPLAEARLYAFPDKPAVTLSARDLQTVAVPDRETDCEGIFRPSGMAESGSKTRQLQP